MTKSRHMFKEASLAHVQRGVSGTCSKRRLWHMFKRASLAHVQRGVSGTCSKRRLWHMFKRASLAHVQRGVSGTCSKGCLWYMFKRVSLAVDLGVGNCGVCRDSNPKNYCGVVPTLFGCFFRIPFLHASFLWYGS